MYRSLQPLQIGPGWIFLKMSSSFGLFIGIQQLFFGIGHGNSGKVDLIVHFVILLMNGLGFGRRL
jgi:hypothetical protein